MKKLLLLATLLGGVSFASHASVHTIATKSALEGTSVSTPASHSVQAEMRNIQKRVNRLIEVTLSCGAHGYMSVSDGATTAEIIDKLMVIDNAVCGG